MWCSETWDCACFKPVQLWVFLSSKIIHMNGGPTMPDMMYPSFISTKLLRVYDCCPLRKIICLVLHRGNKKDLWKLCVEQLHSLKFIIFIDHEEDVICVAGVSCDYGWTQNPLKVFDFILTWTPQDSVRKADCMVGTVWSLKEEVPLEYLQMHLQTLAPPPLPLIVSDMSRSGEVWVQSNRGPYATRGYICTPVHLSQWLGMTDPLYPMFPKGLPQPH